MWGAGRQEKVMAFRQKGEIARKVLASLKKEDKGNSLPIDHPKPGQNNKIIEMDGTLEVI